MSLIFGIAIFFVVWWIVLFAVLPFGVRTQGEAGETVAGTPPSAPARIRIVRIFFINTAVSVIVFGLVWAAIEFDFFNISELANRVQN